MKKIQILIWAIIISSCGSQFKKSNQKIKSQNMEYFNIDVYKDWEVDNYWPQTESEKSLKKGTDRVRISFDKDRIFVVISSTENYYILYKVYFGNKRLKYIGKEFCEFNIGKEKNYNEDGQLISENDEDAPYQFSVEEIIRKFKKEYNIDLEKKDNKILLKRWIPEELNKPVYRVCIKLNDDSNKWEYVLVDGNTGKTLYTTIFRFDGGESVDPFTKYLWALQKQKEEDNTYFTTYKGKDYTKAEWEIFKEQHYKEYERKKESKGFWHDLFKKHDE